MTNGVNMAETGLLKVLKAVTWLVYMIASAAEIFIAFMFFLQLLGANAAQPFVAFIYRWGSMFARPFKGIFPPTVLTGKAFINWNAIVAFAAYAVLAWLVGMALGAVRRNLRKQQSAMAAESAPVNAPTAAPGQPVAPPNTTQPPTQ
jgi:hypothetical protein